jgi:microcystin-dependent protein
MDAFLGEIRAFGFNYPPEYWVMCNGQALPVSQYQALYTVIGNLYGGTPQQTFCVPDLRGRAAMGFGTGTGLSPRAIAAATGAESVTLTQSQVPSHDHSVTAYASSNDAQLSNGPSATSWLSRIKVAASGSVAENFSNLPTPTTLMSGRAVGPALGNSSGSADPHENRQPYLVMNFCICVEGLYPVRP